ncbi:thioredoxin-like protein [Calycina marina]|uniref:Thioredoxin-like protein n=1 Tax=Calycina marina TaxID=1763456 RepID=A0A9P7Z3E4_9HELO|nr:thioredoxin-like protein [Calycina marina]
MPAATADVPVVQIHSISELDKAKSSSRLLFVDFYATWCGPCKQIAPYYEQFATQYSSPIITFAKINVNRAFELSDHCLITAMPTSLIFKDGEEVERWTGTTTPATLEAKIQSWKQRITPVTRAAHLNNPRSSRVRLST